MSTFANLIDVEAADGSIFTLLIVKRGVILNILFVESVTFRMQLDHDWLEVLAPHVDELHDGQETSRTTDFGTANEVSIFVRRCSTGLSGVFTPTF